MELENPRMRGRKRYCCYYCNTFFYQVDSWQRHNRKHTGVEIECEDCGSMCSDHLELKSHQQKCEGFRVYSDDLCMRSVDERQGKQINDNENVNETPDSTSKQESIPENANAEIVETETDGDDAADVKAASCVTNDCQDGDDSSEALNSSNELDESNLSSEPNKLKNIKIKLERTLNNNNNGNCVDNKNSEENNNELDDLIGEDKVSAENEDTPEESDPATEALIGIDQTEVTQMKNEVNEQKPILDSNIGVDTQIIMKVEGGFSVEGKRNNSEATNGDAKDSKRMEWSSQFFNRPSQAGIDSVQTISLENAELNKKYQPYFCKNCGARFTRKDSVTRHLKKGTCSGKSAIVCNICGKVFAEMFELQDHFKMEHKNIVFTPTVLHRSILPRGETPEQGPFPPYPTHYVVHDQHLVPVTRPYLHPEQSYRPMPPGLQTMFYGNPSSYTPRPGYPPPPPGSHFHDPMLHPQAIELKYSPNSQVGKDITFVNNPGKLVLQRAEDISRKREFPRDHLGREQYEDPNFVRKNRKIELEPIGKSRDPHIHNAPGKSPVHQSINLSEYTNNAMNAKQFYDSRFNKSEPSAGKDEPPRTHQCKVCGLEFPRFEYLLTHLRKHKEKDVDRGDNYDEKEKNSKEMHPPTSQHKDSEHPSSTTETFVSTSQSDASSTSSDDANENHKPNFVMSQSSEKPPIVYTTHEPVPVVAPQPHGVHHSLNEMYHEQTGVYVPHSQLGASAIGEGNFEALTPGVDGKFRPFICENCGQRFTRKDSLVRHAKKQTCFEEITDLKCKHCDKTFRYHKCLLQHQELVHGIPHEEHKQPFPPSDEEGSESDKSYKNEIEEDRNADGKYANNNHNEQPTKVRGGKPEYFGHPPYSQHVTRVYPPPPHPPPREHHGEHIMSPRDHPPNNRDAPITVREPPTGEHREEHRDHLRNQHEPTRESRDHPPPPTRVPNSQYHVGPPQFITPIKDDKFKPIDNNNQTNNNGQESQYIGYCMLPRPFQCEYCGDRFAHRHSLKRHVRRHLGIGIPCHDCGKLYRDQSEWRRHQRSIHNRHYEKYEVPSRMSFRDGVEQGLIGIVPTNNNYENNIDNEDETGSEKSDEEVSMAKSSISKYENNSPKFETVLPSDEQTPSIVNNNGTSETGAEYTNGQAKGLNDDKSPLVENREEKFKSFDFKSHISGDKDTRKSVLDLYLCAPNSD